jgi:hypothetical protein
MPGKAQPLYRADLRVQRMNLGKEAKVRALLAAARKIAMAQAREQWRLIFSTGRPSKRHDVSPYRLRRAGHQLWLNGALASRGAAGVVASESE